MSKLHTSGPYLRDFVRETIFGGNVAVKFSLYNANTTPHEYETRLRHILRYCKCGLHSISSLHIEKNNMLDIEATLEPNTLGNYTLHDAFLASAHTDYMDTFHILRKSRVATHS